MSNITKLREKQDRLSNSINKEQGRLEKLTKNRLEAEKANVKIKSELADIDKRLTKNKEKLVNSNKEILEVSALIANKDSIIAEKEKERKEKQNLLKNLITEKEKEILGLNKSILSATDKEKDNKIKFGNEIKQLESTRNALISANKTIAEGTDKLKINNDKLVEIGLEKEIIIDEKVKILSDRNNEIVVLKVKIDQLKKDEKEAKTLAEKQKSDVVALKKNIKELETKQEEEKVKLDKLIGKRVSVSKKEDEVNNAVLEVKRIYKKIGEESPI